MRHGLLVSVRLASRELRAGVAGLRIVLACIALGVMAIAGVGSFSQSLVDGLARDGQVILGGDIAFGLIQREASPAERAVLAGKGRVSAVATLRAMARSGDGGTALVEVKAVDAAYPLYGDLVLEPPAADLSAVLALRDGVFGAAADETLLARLALAPGARLHLGQAEVELRTVIRSEPDKLASGIAFGPRLLISEAALRASGLLQPGSLVRWTYRLRLPEGAASDSGAASAVADVRTQLPDAGWEIRTRTNAAPQLERNIKRFTQFLTLVALTALLVGGVGVANAVKSYLDRKRAVIATMKSLGATGAQVFAIYLTQVMAVALIGSLMGAAVGAALPFLLAFVLGSVVPVPLAPALHPAELVLAVVYGLLTALAFTLWPLGRAHDIPVAALFRDEVAPARRAPRTRYLAASAAGIAVLAGLAVVLAYDRRVALIFVIAAAGVFAALKLVASLIVVLARRVPRARSTVLRLAIANIHRPGGLTGTVVLSLGLGLAVLVTVALIEGNLRRQFVAALPERAPAFFFLDIQGAEADRFDDFVRAHAPGARIERVPMLRGRIVAARGVAADDLGVRGADAWVLQSDRGITYASEIPAGSRVVEGEWWPADYQGPPLVSLEKRVAEALRLKIGDEIVVNVLGRNVAARVANLRTVEWQTLGINFVLVYSPGSFRGAPHGHVATLTYPGAASVADEVALLRAVADAFPAVTAVPVREALDTVGRLVGRLVMALRGASLLTIAAAILVLAGALAASHRHRVYDAVILRVVGATRARLVAAYGIEYALLGLATAGFAVMAGSIAAQLIVTEVMHLRFTWLAGPALAAAVTAVAVTVVLGLVGTIVALRHKPAPLLRNL
jgi:putative ABC transport system permease protein